MICMAKLGYGPQCFGSAALKGGYSDQLETAQRQHADLCTNISGKAVMLHTIILGTGGTCYTEHTLNQFEQLGPPSCH
eukprot:1153000-Pelagomonas_calceolata.AAC.4